MVDLPISCGSWYCNGLCTDEIHTTTRGGLCAALDSGGPPQSGTDFISTLNVCVAVMASWQEGCAQCTTQ